jgi:hypothetical protein
MAEAVPVLCFVVSSIRMNLRDEDYFYYSSTVVVLKYYCSRYKITRFVIDPLDDGLVLIVPSSRGYLWRHLRLIVD